MAYRDREGHVCVPCAAGGNTSSCSGAQLDDPNFHYLRVDCGVIGGNTVFDRSIPTTQQPCKPKNFVWFKNF